METNIAWINFIKRGKTKCRLPFYYYYYYYLSFSCHLCGTPEKEPSFLLILGEVGDGFHRRAAETCGKHHHLAMVVVEEGDIFVESCIVERVKAWWRRKPVGEKVWGEGRGRELGGELEKGRKAGERLSWSFSRYGCYESYFFSLIFCFVSFFGYFSVFICRLDVIIRYYMLSYWS